ncbi:hypothetical protein T492DRAFT_452012 [Pavlovales sp. CCMP2436]|nr:hypothetical protein T492DRAFT_452012 [Pavlovales sp. CCMP2436]
MSCPQPRLRRLDRVARRGRRDRRAWLWSGTGRRRGRRGAMGPRAGASSGPGQRCRRCAGGGGGCEGVCGSGGGASIRVGIPIVEGQKGWGMYGKKNNKTVRSKNEEATTHRVFLEVHNAPSQRCVCVWRGEGGGSYGNLLYMYIFKYGYMFICLYLYCNLINFCIWLTCFRSSLPWSTRRFLPRGGRGGEGVAAILYIFIY